VSLLDLLNDLSTVSTYGFLIVYMLISIAAPCYLWRLGRLSATSIASAVFSVAFIALPIVATVYPTPAPPADKFPYYFLVYLAAGVLWYLVLRMRASSNVMQQIQQDLASD
jgi:hypothetical protein